MPDIAKPPGVARALLDFSRDLVRGIQRMIGDPALISAMRRELGLPATDQAPDRDAVNAKLAELDGKLAAFQAEPGEDFALDERTVEFLLGGRRFVEMLESLLPGRSPTDPRTYGDIAYAFATILASEWMLRPRVPWLHGLLRLLMAGYERIEDVPRFDPLALYERLTGGKTRVAEPGFGPVEALGGLVIPPAVLVLQWLVGKLSDEERLHLQGFSKGRPYLAGDVDFKLGWEPGSEIAPEMQALLARSLTIGFEGRLARYLEPTEFPLKFLVTAVALEQEDGGPGLLLRLGGAADLTLQLPGGAGGAIKRHFSLKLAGGRGADFLWNHEARTVSALGGEIGDFEADLSVESAGTEQLPALRIGKAGKSRLDVRALKWGATVGVGNQFGYLEAKGGELVLKLAEIVPGGALGAFLKDAGTDKIGGTFDVTLKLDSQQGLRFEGSGGLKARLASGAGGTVPGTSIGGRLDYLDLELGPGKKRGTSLGLFAAARLDVGAFTVSFERTGLAAVFTEDHGELVVKEEFSPPKGMGLRLDLGEVRGGGFLRLDYDKGEFAGAFELTFLKFSIQALVVLNTKVPGETGWALFVLGYVRWPVGLELGFRFTLNAVGALVGLQHGFDRLALERALPTGAMDDVLFPKDVVGDAPRVIESLSRIFPLKRGAMTLGFMLELGWGSDRLCSMRLGLILPFENVFERVDGKARLSSLVLLGRIEVVCFKGVPKAIRLQLICDFVGEVGFDPFSVRFYARLRDSRFGVTAIEGAIAVSLVTGQNARLVLSAGGFHPAYAPHVPADLPAPIDRLAVTYDIGLVKAWLRAYFAIAPGTVQFGAELGIRYTVGPLSLGGEFGFDVLIQLPPVFRFEATVYGSVGVKYRGQTLMGVDVRLTLWGPRRWRAKGKGEFSILFWDVSIDFDESWGEEDAIETERRDVAALVRDDLQEPTNWRLEMPRDALPMVTLADGPAPGTGPSLAHPLSSLVYTQARVPFGLPLERFGSALIDGPAFFPVPTVSDQEGRPLGEARVLTETFAIGEYLNLSDQDRLSKPGFQRLAAGVAAGADRHVVPEADRIRSVEVEYEESFDDDAADAVRLDRGGIDLALILSIAAHEAAGRSEARFAARLADRTLAPATTRTPAWVAATATDLVADATAAAPDWASGSPAMVGAKHDAARRRLVLVEDFELGP